MTLTAETVNSMCAHRYERHAQALALRYTTSPAAEKDRRIDVRQVLYTGRTGSSGFTVWIDDIVMNGTRIGCAP